MAANNGVWWRAKLRVVLSDVDAAAEKGIRRGADKASLSQASPVSQWQALLSLTITLGSLAATRVLSYGCVGEVIPVGTWLTGYYWVIPGTAACIGR